MATYLLKLPTTETDQVFVLCKYSHISTLPILGLKISEQIQKHINYDIRNRNN